MAERTRSDEIREERRRLAEEGRLPLRDCDRPEVQPRPRPPRFAMLVRDGVTGRPKFDGNPRDLPADVKQAYRTIMTPEEQDEFFGRAGDGSGGGRDTPPDGGSR